MIRLTTLIDEVRQEGYNEANAEARVCQDIVLKAIDASSFSRHITIKGGVVMRSILQTVPTADKLSAPETRTGWVCRSRMR